MSSAVLGEAIGAARPHHEQIGKRRHCLQGARNALVTGRCGAGAFDLDIGPGA